MVLQQKNFTFAVVVSVVCGMVKEILLLLVMFWNIENFFDPFSGNSGIGQGDFFIGHTRVNAASSEEEPFTPQGEKFWTWKKFERKRDDIARTIALVKEEYKIFPALIGLAEVENRFVLNQLTQNTILAPLEYGVIHNESPDRRGIDVALLYRKSEFRPIEVAFLPLKQLGAGRILSDSMASIAPTREVLYAKGLFKEMDTLHIFVVHWPSKLGGSEAESRREEAGKLLKGRCDSINSSNIKANIIVMGDFNDNLQGYANSCADGLVWMSGGDGRCASEEEKVKKGAVGGTYKYKGKWERIDHFLVSRQMLGSEGLKYLYCREDGSDIFAHPFLLEHDKNYLGYKVRRTLVGPRYNGGVSDHLPILLRVYGYAF